MSSPIYNPGQPYLLPIPNGFSPGNIAHLTGTLTSGATSIVLKFQSGPYGDPNDDVGLCLYARMDERILGLNSFTRAGGWGQEEKFPGHAFVRGQPFEIAILCDPYNFKVALNSQHLGEYPHKLNPASLSHLNVISGPNDINLGCIWIENSAMGPQPAMPAGQAPYPASPGYSSHPGQYQQNYSQQNSSYAPHGGKSNKGLMGMVGSAGAAVAGALGASHLLGKNKGYPSHGGGYTGGHPGQYGGYPGGQGQYGGYPGAGGHKGSGGGLMNKAMAVGGGVLGAKAMSKGVGGLGGLGGSKAMKYGIPLAGVGLGGYMLSKGIGKSFSFDGSCSDSDSD